MQRLRLRVALTALSILLHAGPPPALALLDEPGFRAIPVAQSDYPISALAVAPDGRLFAAVQALGEPEDPDDPAQAEIRVYSDYATTDGAILDEGTVWATINDVRATNVDEGLLGIALAPDFSTSKLVYVYVTTEDDEVNQHVHAYRETAAGTGTYLGTVATDLEPPVGSSFRNGGGLTFGTDGCLYVGIGDNASPNRWNAQVLRGTDPIRSSERNDFCSDICLGPDEYPDRSDDNDLPNQAGKVLRIDVEGASTAQPGWGAALPAQPYAFGTGLGNPMAMGVHPLTGQLFVAERGESDEAELNVVDSGSNSGWPCLEGTNVGSTGDVSCLSGSAATDVYANHSDWRRPIATHDGNPVILGPTAYTGRGYPAEFYGDMFYLLRDGARIYRLGLHAPCFLPNPAGIIPLPFHDSDDDGDFRAYYDEDGDGDFENLSFTNLMAMVQGPSPHGDVLYVTGRRNNSSALDADSIVFRIEYATSFIPFTGVDTRIPDSCYTQGPFSGGTGATVPYAYENPFFRPTCLPAGGPCPNLPDGTPCDDRDVCNGGDTCQAGICRHGVAAADGTGCAVPGSCRSPGQCVTGSCITGPVVPDGTPCPDAEPCNGLETCLAGACQAASGPAPLGVNKVIVKRGKKPGTSSVMLAGTVSPVLTVQPSSNAPVGIELLSGPGVLYTGMVDQPSTDGFWKRSRRGFIYKDKGGIADGITNVNLQSQKKSRAFAVKIKSKRLSLPALANASLNPKVIIGDECFAADLSEKCRLTKRKLKCKK